MLRALVGLLLAGGLITPLYLVSAGAPLQRIPAAGESGWQLRELALLKAAHDRIQHDLTRPSKAAAALHAERERVMRQMAETAKLLPAEKVPAEVRALFPKAEAAPGSSPPPGATTAAAARKPDPVAAPAPELRAGLRLVALGSWRQSWRADEFAIDPRLREPIAQEPAPPPEERTSRRKPRDTARRGQP